MPQFKDYIQLQTTSAEPVVVRDVRVTPQSQALVIRLPFGGFVWNRPTSVLVERDDMTQRIPIVDVTSVVQIALLGLGLAISVIIIASAAQRARQRRIPHE